jgi:aspartate aminotransferase
MGSCSFTLMCASALLVGVCAGTTLSPRPPGTCVTRSIWKDVPQGADDPILGLNQAFGSDPSPNKVSLGVGAYRDAEGKPYVLRAVRAAEERIMAAKLPKEYAPIGGTPEYVNIAVALMLGDNSTALAEGRVAAVQTLSGTGACRVAAEMLSRFPSADAGADPIGAKIIYVPEPTWSNHWNIFGDAGLLVRGYRYWNPKTLGLDLDGLLDDLRAAPPGATVLLHACAHNPTGVDPTPEQWSLISDICESRGLRVLFDSAYQGFASGDPERDAAAVRLFVERGHAVMLAQSFAKNFGLYGERVGALSVVTASADEAKRVTSQLKLVIRPMYSSPPLHGARIVTIVLGDSVRASGRDKPQCSCARPLLTCGGDCFLQSPA